MTDTSTPTDEELIGRFVALRNKIAVMNEYHEKQVKPYTEAMNTIANYLQEQLNARGAESTKTDAGTAYLSTVHRVSVKDRDALMAHIMATGHTHLLASSVSKEAVEEYMALNEGRLPPGVERTGFTKVNVRKS